MSMPQEIYIVLHVPKTAGMTLRANIQRNFKPHQWLLLTSVLPSEANSGTAAPVENEVERAYRNLEQGVNPHLKCIFGHHAYYGIHELVAEKLGRPVAPRYMTFLREPVARVISGYFYLKHNPRSVWHRELVENNWSLEEWFVHSKYPGRHNGQLSHLLISSFEDLACQRPVERDDLEIMKERLRNFWYIGLTETFADDASYLYGKLGFCLFSSREVVNASRQREEVPASARRLIAEHNVLDIELYDYARTLRSEAIAGRKAEYQWNRRKSLVLQALFKAARAVAKKSPPKPPVQTEQRAPAKSP